MNCKFFVHFPGQQAEQVPSSSGKSLSVMKTAQLILLRLCSLSANKLKVS